MIAEAEATAGVDLIAEVGMIAEADIGEGVEENAAKSRDDGQPLILYMVVQPILSKKDSF